MAPNLCKNDRAFVLASNAGLKRGQIVTFFPPLPKPYNQKLYLGRILGLPGENISLRKNLQLVPQNEVVTIPTFSILSGGQIIHPIVSPGMDSDAFSESILGVSYSIRKSAQEPVFEESSFSLKADEYFLMVDNRDFSTSPGAFPFGVVNAREIAWTFLFRYWRACKRPPTTMSENQRTSNTTSHPTLYAIQTPDPDL
ncbi:MAG: hypothetical protein JNM27_03425 [Leptospirales bacterium]|nr:hypothetical protein [Leptospirales bacterium]